MTEPDYLTEAEVARLLAVTPHFVRRLIRDGDLRARTCYEVRRTELARYINRHEVPQKRDPQITDSRKRRGRSNVGRPKR